MIKEKCLGCGGDASDNYFDRSLCPCEHGPDWGVMHTRCRNCGTALDGCAFELDIQALLPLEP